MVRYFMELAYNGTHYHGWQIQPNGISVQEKLEIALSTILRQSVTVTGAGRTDAGVHAKYMVAHFDLPEEMDPPSNKLVAQLNGFLPADIAVYSVTQVADAAHARFDAVARKYAYHITLGKNPFTQNLAARINYSLDFDAMNEAAALLLDCDDFTSFSKLHSGAKTNICKVSSAFWEEQESQWVFSIQANRFLRDMVRAIVGTLLEVGRSKLSLAQFADVIEAKDRGKAGVSTPAGGLYLVDITYPPEIFKKSDFL